VTTPFGLPPEWMCSTWPAGWQPGVAMPLVQVGNSTLPEKFYLAVHTPDMPAPGAAVLFTYAARNDAVTLLEIASLGMEVGAHLGQVLSVLAPDALQQIAQSQVAAFVPALTMEPNVTPVNGKAIRRYVRVTDDHLKEVAAIYGEAHGAGAAPTRAVQHHFGVSHSTAAKWAGRARKQGLLAPTTPEVAR
jgi:hypothetical protein